MRKRALHQFQTDTVSYKKDKADIVKRANELFDIQ